MIPKLGDPIVDHIRERAMRMVTVATLLADEPINDEHMVLVEVGICAAAAAALEALDEVDAIREPDGGWEAALGGEAS